MNNKNIKQNKDVQTSLAQRAYGQTSLNIFAVFAVFVLLAFLEDLFCFLCCCAALSFGVLARTPLSPGPELSGGLASKGEI